MPAQKEAWGRFVVYLRTDGKYALADLARACGARTISLHRTEAEAGKAADKASAAAKARGEPSGPEHS